MATYRQNLQTRLNNIACELANLTPASMGGKANVKAQDGGTTIDHVGYRKSLLEEQAQLLKALEQAPMVEASAAGEDGPFEIETHVSPGF